MNLLKRIWRKLTTWDTQGMAAYWCGDDEPHPVPRVRRERTPCDLGNHTLCASGAWCMCHCHDEEWDD